MRYDITRTACAIATVAMVAAAFVTATSNFPARSQAAVQLMVVDVAAVGKGYRASKLIGSSVVNDKDEKIGTLDDLIVDPQQVLFAVLQVGGFLGVGGHLVAVPYKSLVLDHPGGKVELPGASKDELKKLPEFRYI
jgi:sporulation protein YlmC with PRC-barrel domain